ncbi:FecR family protein [Thalassobellus citreus]|uniref:FecR family protein n=1 Tax=Thalassobellus citreus TaxID=3367752 RepID=UPI0037A33712
MKQRIIKFLYGEISDHDMKLLRVWLENPKNYKKFKKQVKLFYLFNNKPDQESIDLAYKKLQTSINPTINIKSKSRKRIPIWMRYVAAACVVLGSVYFYTNTSNKQEVVTTNFPIGTDKATLTLSNGTSISLNKGESFDNSFVTSNGEELIYDSKSKVKTKKQLHYNYLTVPRGGQFFMELADGTKVWLNSESKIKYPVKFLAGETRSVELIYGEAYFKVSKSSNHNGDGFSLKTNEQNITVLGTEFNVKAYKDETDILTTLIEGSVAVNNNVDKKVLLPGEQSKLSQSASQFEVYSIEVGDEIAWRDSMFNFTNKPLNEIMKVLSRWYDLDITIVSNDMKTIEFTGALSKKQSIYKILEAIKSTTDMEYTFNNKNLIIK